jgi:hypothetical protein
MNSITFEDNPKNYIMKLWPSVFIELLKLDFQTFQKTYKIILNLDNQLILPDIYKLYYDWPLLRFHYQEEIYGNIFAFISSSNDISDKQQKIKFLQDYLLCNETIYAHIEDEDLEDENILKEEDYDY